MNKVSLFIILLSLSLTSCKKQQVQHQAAFEKSYQKWLQFKKEYSNSYTYTVVRSSWVGYNTKTDITVENGVVVKRHYSMQVMPDYEGPLSSHEWTEEAGEINSHTSEGADAITLDEVYNKCKNEWLLKRDNAKTFFEAENNGLISACGYIPDGCMDDCTIGIVITGIMYTTVM